MPSKSRPTKVRADATYLLTGGSGGLGCSITKFLVQQGARHIVLASRQGPESAKVQALIEELAGSDANIVPISCDVGDMENVRALVTHCAATMPPIRGVIHGAMVLDVSSSRLSPPARLIKIVCRICSLNVPTPKRTCGSCGLRSTACGTCTRAFLVTLSTSSSTSPPRPGYGAAAGRPCTERHRPLSAPSPGGGQPRTCPQSPFILAGSPRLAT